MDYHVVHALVTMAELPDSVSIHLSLYMRLMLEVSVLDCLTKRLKSKNDPRNTTYNSRAKNGESSDNNNNYPFLLGWQLNNCV